MLIKNTPIPGALIIVPEPVTDERGFFARTWCQSEFKAYGIDVTFVQCSLSFNLRKGTLRGMHFQIEPHAEVKLVRCTAGTIYDVIVDARISSPTFKKWHAVELSAENRLQVFVPRGVAHGFLTREHRAVVTYQISEFYREEQQRRFRYDDPALAIPWPQKVTAISEKDKTSPMFDEMEI